MASKSAENNKNRKNYMGCYYWTGGHKNGKLLVVRTLLWKFHRSCLCIINAIIYSQVYVGKGVFHFLQGSWSYIYYMLPSKLFQLNGFPVLSYKAHEQSDQSLESATQTQGRPGQNHQRYHLTQSFSTRDKFTSRGVKIVQSVEND